MPVDVASRRCQAKTLHARFGDDAELIDVTSKASQPWVRLSPFYPHGGLPVPFSPGRTAASVEGVWQALKVFDSQDVDPSKLAIDTMRGLKRTVRRLGPVRGHRRGLGGADLLDYRTARVEIYLPTYRYVLEHRCPDLVDELRERAATRTVVLLDYTVNGDVDDLSTPLSHASLVSRFVQGNFPKAASTRPQ